MLRSGIRSDATSNGENRMTTPLIAVVEDDPALALLFDDLVRGEG